MKSLYLAFFVVFIFSCNSNTKKRSKLIHYVPETNTLIIRTANLESLNNSLNNNDFLQNFSKTNSYRTLEKKLKNVSYLKPAGDLLICLNKTSLDSLDFTLITKHHKDLFLTDSLKNYSEEYIKTTTGTYNKSIIDNSTFYNTIVDSVFIASSSKEQIIKALNTTKTNESLDKIYHTINTDKSLSFIFESSTPLIHSFFLNENLNLKTLTSHMAIDVDISQDQVLINGITKAKDSSGLINIFKNTVPQENKTQYVTPSNSDGFLSFTFDNYNIFQENLNNFNKKDSLTLTTETTLFNDVIELGVIYEDNNRAIVLNSIDAIATNDALISEQTIAESYRGIDVFSFSKPKLFSTLFSPLISFEGASKYCQLDDFFIFCNDIEMLQNIIANYQNKTTLSHQSYYKTVKNQLSDEASLIQIATPSSLKKILKRNLNESLSKSFSPYKSSAIQFIYDTNFAHINGIVQKSKNRVLANSVSEELNIKLDTEVLNAPQFVINHITRQKEIVVQDISNNLYLINNKGKVLWKKRLNGRILGEINQMDIYKNGRLQLVFSTPHRVYVLDRNGNEVAPFPLKFNDDITQPLSVFDYDKKKNYRLLVTQGKDVLMYDGKGKIVKGFTFKKTNGKILNKPQHFRIGSKDYITVKTQNKLYILDRTGKTRVSPKSSTTFSNAPISLYNNKFTTTTANGKLISIDAKGNTASQNLNLSSNHYITSTSKTLVTHSDNKLNIRNKTVDLDYGNYSKPQIFYINDKIYVSVTDLQSHKVHLYDSQAKSIPNFPVYGNSVISLDNIDKDQSLEFVTKGDKNSIILYQIN